MSSTSTALPPLAGRPMAIFMASMAYVNFASIVRNTVPNTTLEIITAMLISQKDADTVRNLLSELDSKPEYRHYPDQGVWRVIAVF